MTGRRALLLLGVVVVVSFLLFVLWASQEVYWVGGADVEVTFVVTDGDTGRPIRGATVEVVQEEGGFCGDRGRQTFELTTDAEGTASHLAPRCMSFGRGSILPWRNTFGVHLPPWTFRASAPGYEPTGPCDLGAGGYRRLVRRRGNDAAVTVPLTLSPLPRGG